MQEFKEKRRILYAAPTAEQLEKYWTEVTRALAKPIDDGILYKNETLHLIDVRGTNYRIKAKTAWNADTLRGDYADLLILDEWQLMNEDAWEFVGMPMLLDNDGNAIFLFTPPSLHSRSVSKAKDIQHASKMYEKYKDDKTGRWATFHWTSYDNPHLSKKALVDITKDMTSIAHDIEIMAQDIDQAQGALWKKDDIEKNRVIKAPELSRIVVGVDPSTTSGGDEAGIITAGLRGEDGYILSDDSIQGSPLVWATAAVTAFHKFKADRIIAESNNGGEMVELTIKQVDPSVPVKLVTASRGKQTRAEPIAANYEKGRVHHVGKFERLEREQCLWVPGDPSPNRMDAAVWALTDLLLTTTPGFFFVGGGTRKQETKVQEKTESSSQDIRDRFREKFDRGD